MRPVSLLFAVARREDCEIDATERYQANLLVLWGAPTLGTTIQQHRRVRASHDASQSYYVDDALGEVDDRIDKTWTPVS